MCLRVKYCRLNSIFNISIFVSTLWYRLWSKPGYICKKNVNYVSTKFCPTPRSKASLANNPVLIKLKNRWDNKWWITQSFFLLFIYFSRATPLARVGPNCFVTKMTIDVALSPIHSYSILQIYSHNFAFFNVLLLYNLTSFLVGYADLNASGSRSLRFYSHTVTSNIFPFLMLADTIFRIWVSISFERFLKTFRKVEKTFGSSAALRHRLTRCLSQLVGNCTGNR